MKSIEAFVAVIALVASFGSSITEIATVTAATMNGAEAKIAAQAQAAGTLSYRVTEAFIDNRAHITAGLNK